MVASLFCADPMAVQWANLVRAGGLAEDSRSTETGAPFGSCQSVVPSGLSSGRLSERVGRIPAMLCDDVVTMRHNDVTNRFRSVSRRLVHCRKELVAAACVGALTLPAASIVSAGASGGANRESGPQLPWGS